MSQRSLLDELLDLAGTHGGDRWFQESARAFLEVCELFGAYAVQHHDALVNRFIERPSTALSQVQLQGVTASGPPLPVLMRSLEVLRDLRVAADRGDIPSRRADLERLRALLR
jgi:hypothetical protein